MASKPFLVLANCVAAIMAHTRKKAIIYAQIVNIGFSLDFW